MTISGKVIDTNNNPVPRATVALLNGNVTLSSNAADDNGNFTLSTSQAPDNLLITSVGYQPMTWNLPEYSGITLFQLETSTDPLSTVIVTYKPKSKFPWLLLIALGLIVLDKKKKLKIYAHTR